MTEELKPDHRKYMKIQRWVGGERWEWRIEEFCMWRMGVNKERREWKSAKYFDLVRTHEKKIEKLWLGTGGHF